MQKLVVSFFVFFLSFVAIPQKHNLFAQQQESEGVNWLSFEEALRLNAEAPRNILIDVYTDWCSYCRAMDAQTFKNPVIAQYINQNFYAIKFNAESTESIQFNGRTYANPGVRQGNRRPVHQFTSFLGVTGYPTVVYFKSSLEKIDAYPGFYRPHHIEPLLHYIVTQKYLEMSLEDFQKTFVGEFSR